MSDEIQTPKFALGDTVFRAAQNVHEVWDDCPECGGTRKLKVTLFDSTEYDIDCQGCASGFNPPCGKVRRTEHTARAESATIKGIVFEEHRGLVYVLSTGYHIMAQDVAATEAEALERAAVLNAEWNEKEKQRVARKTHPERSWAWHVHYHRKRIRDAQKDLEWSTRALGIAKEKAKLAGTEANSDR